MAIGYWLLAIGYWLLAIGYWLVLIAFSSLSNQFCKLIPCDCFILQAHSTFLQQALRRGYPKSIVLLFNTPKKCRPFI
ncbi:MAG: hypothetical protein DWQ05_17050 [Calditrichaeota bacterium]|nr:MAG: hypothetical protein DWQ05_17050 [Calditrichota bacterium]